MTNAELEHEIKKLQAVVNLLLRDGGERTIKWEPCTTCVERGTLNDGGDCYRCDGVGHTARMVAK